MNLALGKLSLWEIAKGREAEQQGDRLSWSDPALDNVQIPPQLAGEGPRVHPGTQGPPGNSWVPLLSSSPHLRPPLGSLVH